MQPQAHKQFSLFQKETLLTKSHVYFQLQISKELLKLNEQKSESWAEMISEWEVNLWSLAFSKLSAFTSKDSSQNSSKAHNAESMEASKLNKDWPANTKAEWRLS